MNHPVILFDGICNLCNWSVQFVIRRDPGARFRFASLQSSYGQEVLAINHLLDQQPSDVSKSFLLLENGRIFTRSTAAIKVLSMLKNYGWTKVFLLIPPFIRNAVYDLIAVNRYRWFGKQNSCMVPTPELVKRFLE